jgi:hypothetical protein
MSCTSCGSSSCGSSSGSSCGSCTDDCNPCGGPVSIITKQGLTGATGPQGPAGPANANDRYGYYTTSSSTVNVSDLYTAPGDYNFTVGLNLAFRPADTVRVSNAYDLKSSTAFFEGQVTSYDSLTGALVVSAGTDISAVNSGVPVRKVVGQGSYSSWHIQLMDQKNINIDNHYKLVFSAKRAFSNGATTYIPTTDDDLSIAGGITENRLIFDPADPDVTILTDLKSSHFEHVDPVNGMFNGIQVRAVEIGLHVPKGVLVRDWVTPVNIAGTDYYRPASMSIVRQQDMPDYGSQAFQDASTFHTLSTKTLSENTGTIMMRGVDQRFERHPTSGAGSAGHYFFKILNDSDLDVVGGSITISGGAGESSTGYYSIKVYI